MTNNVFNIFNLHLVFGNNKFRLENINNLSIKAGEIIGILGESGCGKSTFGKCLIGLINHRDNARFDITQLGVISSKNDTRIEFPAEPNLFWNNDVLSGTNKELQLYRRNYAQMIFQNPTSALNLNMPVHRILEEAIRLEFPTIKAKHLKNKVEKIARNFGIGGDNWKSIAKSKPKDMSGGERRRLGVAKVFATNPDKVIADEPVASLDVSVRQKILETIFEEWSDRKSKWEKGKRKHPLTIIIISHDFDLIQKMCHRTIVFYGDIHVKRGTVVEVFENNKLPVKMHPYTEKLRQDAKYMNTMHNIIIQNNKKEKRRKIITSGCVYVNKCCYAQNKCFECSPELKGNENYSIACYNHSKQMVEEM